MAAMRRRYGSGAFFIPETKKRPVGRFLHRGRRSSPAFTRRDKSGSAALLHAAPGAARTPFGVRLSGVRSAFSTNDSGRLSGRRIHPGLLRLEFARRRAKTNQIPVAVDVVDAIHGAPVLVL